MNLKNYTSEVPAERSIMQIEMMLARAGAGHIGKFYDKQDVVGFTFQLPVGGEMLLFKLPARVGRVEKMMVDSIRRPNKAKIESAKAQARRTAWKLLYDWTCVQISMIQLEQANPGEVFMPYLYDAQRDRTLFERWEETAYKALLPATDERDHS